MAPADDAIHESQDEQSPLLRHSRPSSTQPTARRDDEAVSRVLTRIRALLCAALIITAAVVEMIFLFQMLATNQILEDIICSRIETLEPDGRVDCGKNAAVQAEIAQLRGWQVTFDFIPGVLTAVPYGRMADEHGPKTVLLLCVFGISSSYVFYGAVCWWPEIFPVRLTWLSSCFQLIGGGSSVLSSLVFSILADLMPTTYRSTAFFAFGATVFIFELFGGPLASALMQLDAWLPIYVGFALYFPVFLFILFLPKDFHGKERDNLESPPQEADETVQRESLDDQQANNRSGVQESRMRNQTFSELMRELIRVLTKSWLNFTFFFREMPISALLFTRLTTTLGKSAQEILLQFTRRRFGWTWSQTGFLVSLKAGLVLILLAAILPTLDFVLLNVFFLRPLKKDFYIAWASCLFLLAGNILIGLAMTDKIMLLGVSIWCMGSGYNLVLRSILVQLVEPTYCGTLLTTVAMLENLSSVVAGPVFALTFRLGLSLSGGEDGGGSPLWIGLPFMTAAALLCITVVVLSSIRMA